MLHFLIQCRSLCEEPAVPRKSPLLDTFAFRRFTLPISIPRQTKTQTPAFDKTYHSSVDESPRVGVNHCFASYPALELGDLTTPDLAEARADVERGFGVFRSPSAVNVFSWHVETSQGMGAHQFLFTLIH